MTSQIITYPDILNKTNNTSLLLIDADIQQVQDLALFCAVSNKNYTIYLYNNNVYDLEWLSTVTNLVDIILISDNSTITIQSCDPVYFGTESDLKHPLTYLQHFDNQGETI